MTCAYNELQARARRVEASIDSSSNIESSLTSRGKRWELLHSLWVAWTFTLGFFSWVAFFYIGARARQVRWILWGVVYLVPFAYEVASRASTRFWPRSWDHSWQGVAIFILYLVDRCTVRLPCLSGAQRVPGAPGQPATHPAQDVCHFQGQEMGAATFTVDRVDVRPGVLQLVGVSLRRYQRPTPAVEAVGAGLRDPTRSLPDLFGRPCRHDQYPTHRPPYVVNRWDGMRVYNPCLPDT
jgi:hypothetical protein